MTTSDFTPEEFAKLRQIYLEAVNLPESEHDGFLAEACEGDAMLEQEIRDLSRAVGLPTADLPASACLSSLFASKKEPHPTVDLPCLEL